MNLTKLRNALSLFDRFRPLKRPQFPVNTKLVARQEYARAQLVADRRDGDRESEVIDLRKRLSQAVADGEVALVKRLTRVCAALKKTGPSL